MSRFDFLPVLRYLLIRLVRIAMGCGITYQTFAKLLRSVYFEVARDFEPVKGKPNSDSRISLLTGLPRREVRALRGQEQEPQVPVASIERLVLDAWSSRLELIGDDGKRRPLARTARLGGEQSFESLVEGISKDIRARSLLDEWLRKGFVVLDEEDRVVLGETQPADNVEGVTGASLLLAELISDLLNGFERGYLLGRPQPGYQYHVVYGHRLTEESASLVCAEARRESSELAHRLNRLVVRREAMDANNPDAVERVTFGMGCFRTDGRAEPGLLGPAQQGAAAVRPAASGAE